MTQIRYGISGLAGVMLREDFIEAVETLKSVSGMVTCDPKLLIL